MYFSEIVSFVKLNLFFILFENLLVFLVLLECYGQVKLVNGAIIVIAKRAEIERGISTLTVKTYCKISDKENEEQLGGGTNFLKLNCSHVPGPVRKLKLGEDNYLQLDNGHFIAPSEFCAFKGNPSFGKLCPSHSDPLWRKCCGENELLDATSFRCRQSRIKYRPKVKGSSILQSFTVVKNNSRQEQDSKGILGCGTGFVPRVYSSLPCLPESAGSFQLASNGTPMYQVSTGVFLRKTQLKSVDQDSYCVDGLLDFSSTFQASCAGITGNYDENSLNYNDHFAKCQKGMGEVLLACMEEQDMILNEDGDEKGVPKVYFFAALWLSTCPLLISAAIANSCVIQRNVHGWILTSYLISMFLVNINSVILILDVAPSSTIVNNAGISSATSHPPSLDGGCGILDFTMKFIYMSTLCWMTSMNFGLWRTFSSSVPQAVQPQRFLLSAIFSLGFPIISVSISYYMGSLPDDDDDADGGDDFNFPSIYHPGGNNNTTNTKAIPAMPTHTCRKGSCPLYSYKTLPYYSGPIIFLVLCNVAAFLKTSTTIASLRRQAEAVLHKQTRDHLESFTLFAKLFLLTGSIWVIRVALLVLQIQGLYVTWYGVALEAVFSIPEVVFPMIIFHHPEFIKWAWNKSPVISRVLVKCNPFCWKDSSFKEVGNSLELQSGNQISGTAQHPHHQVRHASSTLYHNVHYSDQSRSQRGTSDPATQASLRSTGGGTMTVATFTSNEPRDAPA